MPVNDSTRSLERTWPNWFNAGYAEALFTQRLWPLRGKPGLRFLQLGAFSGDASAWLTEHILTGLGSTLTDVDTWTGDPLDPGTASIDFGAVRSHYRDRIVGDPRVLTYEGDTDAFFDGLIRSRWDKAYDFIYVDAAHDAEHVLRDAVNADRYLASGGLIAFDDYRWGAGREDRPAVAIDAFLRCYRRRYQVLEMDLQVWARKGTW